MRRRELAAETYLQGQPDASGQGPKAEQTGEKIEGDEAKTLFRSQMR